MENDIATVDKKIIKTMINNMKNMNISMNIADSLTVSIVEGKRDDLGREWRGRCRTPPYARLYAVKKGRARVTIQGNSLDLVPGHLYLLPTGVTFDFHCEDAFTLQWLHFRLEVHGQMNLFDVVETKTVVPTADHDSATATFQSILDGIDKQSVAAQLRLRAKLLDLISPFFDESSTDADWAADLSIFLPIIAHVQDNLSSPPSVSELAAIAGYEKNYFTVLFKRAFGVSPRRFIQHERVRVAASMLGGSKRKFAEIAERLGYADAFHFSRAFKAIMGCSPREYRKETALRRP